ncbi:DUF2198 family protein [Aneurinibacillus tyrosinisolvens]|uniref:DUF2198 family protein n=1 Tax=Aneurinibacillus tyrosinisolvens TaxID=1443435 RepID=UPI00063F2225|nr:DUF2198 family protein [Aneurinibacillus tyrosinisolvens]
MIGKIIVALLVPFALAAGLSRFSMNIWVGMIATLGIMMAAFNGPYQPLPVVLTGVVSGLAGTYVGYLWLKGKSITK